MKKKDGKEVLSSLYNMISMIIISKFDIKKISENNYQPWDTVSVKHKKALRHVDQHNERRQIIDLCKKSFFKIYPLNLDSANVDPTKMWLMGIQVVAMNMQTLTDDYLLINNVFFKAFGSSGYVLKPPKLLFGSSEYETYENPVGNVKIELMAGFMLHLLFGHDSQTERSLTLTTNIIGHTNDDNDNRKYQAKVTSNFLNCMFDDEVYQFKVYEKDLSFIFIKITSNIGVVGRCVIPLCAISEGYRTIPIYDNLCDQHSDSVLICRVSKSF
jgi:hypothetical protein